MPQPPRQFDAIVLGAGAAGLFCAATAGGRGRRVLLLDHGPRAGRKILVSGGGRANFTNLHCSAKNYLSQNPHFVKSALALYEPRHFVELLGRYRIGWHEKTQGQLFCDGPASQLVEMLLSECAHGKVEILLNARKIAVERGSGGGFCVLCSAGEFQAEALVVATGGLSIPKLDATGLGYELARDFGLKIEPTRPALVPLTLGGAEATWKELSGVAVEVEARAGSACFRDQLLFTHRGLSGPAILQASSYWQPGEPLEVDFAPGQQKLLASLLRPQGRRDLANFRKALREALPQRLADRLTESATPSGWTNAALDEAERKLHRWSFHPTGTEGYAKAEVTAGGVSTGDLQARTLEARKVPGLFFVGEVADVTGWLGGYNLHWAWASGAAAGRSL